jgi:prepilin-type N-terminal cleavage/methylation domain-containing protein
LELVLLIREPSPEAERGVTLVETLVALLILSLVALSVLQIFSQGVQLNVTGANYTAITNVVKDKSEELLAMDFNHVDLTPDTTRSETLVDPPLAVTWRVGEHQLVQGSDDPTTAFGVDPLVSTAVPGFGNVKVIAVTVASQSSVGLGGNRDVTVLAIKSAD